MITCIVTLESTASITFYFIDSARTKNVCFLATLVDRDLSQNN